jgi:hypothetical protein
MTQGMRNYRTFINRRYFCCSIGGLAINVALAKLPFRGSKIATTNVEFVVVNGWVLTREDLALSQMIPVAASEIIPNVV